jgi:hypothetical protein
MEIVILWLIENWDLVLLIFFATEKAVKVSPCKWDDLLVDGIKCFVTTIITGLKQKPKSRLP